MQIWEELFEELLQIKYSMEKLTAREKEIKDLMLTDLVWNTEFDGHMFQKITQNRVALKEDVEISTIKAKFGDECIKYSVDMDVLKEIPEAHEYLELKPVSFIKISKIKDGKWK